MNAAFCIRLSGPKHPAFHAAGTFLDAARHTKDWKETAQFYLDGIERIAHEIGSVRRRNRDFNDALETLGHWSVDAENKKNIQTTAEKIWAVFFPEAVGLWHDTESRIDALREKRTLKVVSLKPDPITDPARQLLFTANVLLTLPASGKSRETDPLSQGLKDALTSVLAEPQQYWFDHPVQIGVAPENNEILYGLRGLEQALSFEKTAGNAAEDARLTCILSVSVTHAGLHVLAKRYLKETFKRSGGFKDLDVYMFTETDTDRIAKEILSPAARHYMGIDDTEALLSVFGVDGEYGRHYSFLKAVAALWQVLCSPGVKATFKIDLDQVFPQKELVAQTGASAFEHFKTPLWGAKGVDIDGGLIDLGMIAGALVDEKDIHRSIFTPDVPFPDRSPAPEEYVFFNRLPQAISTRAEMMTRYDTDALDGRRRCIQRIHITGGTNGILVESLFRHRPFTPSFIGRAEDQAYLLSVLCSKKERLGYVHEAGLIMRHDKEAFAQEAIASARIGTLINDYVRILYFSAYARVLTDDIAAIKKTLDPFTGCFISKIPETVVMLRFALKAASLFSDGKEEQGNDFVVTGAARLKTAFAFTHGEDSALGTTYEKERCGWHLYYDTLAALKTALEEKEDFAKTIREKTRAIIRSCRIN